MRGHVRQRHTPKCTTPKRCKCPYAVVVELSRDPASNARRQRWHSGFPTKKAAEAKLTELVNSLNTGSYVEASRQTVRDYLVSDWLPSIVDTIRPSTWHSYDRNVRLHVLPTLGDRKLVDVDGAALNALYAELRRSGKRNHEGGTSLSPRSVTYVHTILHRAFRDAVTLNRIVRNPCDAARPPKASATEADRPEMSTWAPAELETFLRKSRESDDRYYPALLMLATTGARRGEVLGLRWSDLDLDTARASIRQTLLAVVVDGKQQVIYGTPKTRAGRRSIALDAVTVAALRDGRKMQLEERLAFGPGYAGGDLVFCRPDGTPYHPDRFSREFVRRVVRWGLPRIRLHDLRHTHATMALERGVHPRVVQERLGHSNVGITLGTYSHVTPAMDASAADIIAAAIFGPGAP